MSTLADRLCIMIRALSLLTFLLLATACTTQYHYIPPSSQAGIQCVSQCQQRQHECKQGANLRADAEHRACLNTVASDYQACQQLSHSRYHACQSRSEAEYSACLKYSDNRSECRREPCSQTHCARKQCYHAPQYGSCQTDFNQCFQQCGGRLQEVE